MDLNIDPAVGIVGLIILSSVCIYALIHLSTESRFRRKRRRNYGKVVPRVKRPVVLLSVKGDKH
jgi:hypothetical protein